MWHLGVKKDATLILLVGIFVVLSVNIFLLLMKYQTPTRCIDSAYNPSLITGRE
jgi:hypothetical protein